MAVYTTLVRTIAEQTYLNQMKTSDTSVLQGKSIDEILNVTWPYLIPFTMVDGNGLTKENVIKAVCRHYWMREIGLETVGLWKYAIGTRLQEIMPKYQEMALAQVEMGSIWETGKSQKIHNGEYVKGSTNQESGTSNRKIDETGTSANTVGTTGNRNIDRTTTEDATTTFNTTRGTTDDEKTSHQDEYMKTTNTTNTNDLTDTSTGSNTLDSHVTNEASKTGSNSSDSKDKFSDTPQNGLTSVEEGMYLTTYRNIDESGSMTESTRFDNQQNDESTSTVTDKHTGTTTSGVTEDQESSGSGNRTTTTNVEGKDTTILDNDGKETVKETTGSDVDESGNTSRNVTDNDTTSKSGSMNENGTDYYTDTLTGFDGNKIEFMAQYNELYVNIYQMIIGEVSGFFMTIMG